MDRNSQEGSGRRAGKMWIVLLLVLVLLAVTAFIIYKVPYFYGLSNHIVYQMDDEIYGNPLIGYAAMGDNPDKAEQTRLIYILLTWREWEPSEGCFDINGLEQRYHIPRWKAEGKNAVLRFVCDIPGNEEHRDIPDWLYERTKDGTDYDTDYGKGYSPVYENPVFIEAHQKALKALGEYCKKDNFVSYVQLGSLGHWGEWHTKYEDGVYPMPDEAVCRIYTGQYLETFPQAKLMTRRNYAIAVDENMGIYNDMTGMKEDTEEWLGWMTTGGAYEIPGRRIAYKPVFEVWNEAPVGGEFTSAIPMEELLGKRLVDTVALIRDSHMTFIGPKCPDIKEMDSNGSKEILKNIGYRYAIKRMDIHLNILKQTFTVDLLWKNTGVAPIYFDWPVNFYVLDKNGEVKCSQKINIDLRKLIQGKEYKTSQEFSFNDLFREGFTIGIGICDPLTELPKIELGMNKEFRDGINLIYTYDGSKGYAFD